jgi:hypothetical protein
VAASALRHYVAVASTAPSTVVAITSAMVPTARALVIGKLVVTAATTATYGVYTSPSGGGASTYVMPIQSMTAGAIYSETGLVLTAGEQLVLVVNALGSGGSVWVQIFGEEVDN